MRTPTERLYSVLESRYEAELTEPSEGTDLWTAIVWLVTKTSRMQLARFQDVCETAARNAAYTFIMDRPR